MSQGELHEHYMQAFLSEKTNDVEVCLPYFQAVDSSWRLISNRKFAYRYRKQVRMGSEELAVLEPSNALHLDSHRRQSNENILMVADFYTIQHRRCLQFASLQA